MASLRGRLAPLWLTAILLASWSFCLVACGGTALTKKYSGLDPLRITFDPDPKSEQMQSSCEQIKITVSTIVQPSPQDRQLEVVLYVAGHYQYSIAYRQKIFLPQAASSASASFVYIQPEGFSRFVLDVLENGSSILEPQASITSLSISYYSEPSDPLWCCAITAAPTPGNALPFPPEFYGNSLKIDNFTIVDSPLDWRAYLKYSFVVWPAELFGRASAEQLRALSTYAASGGTVIAHLSSRHEDQRQDLLRVDQALCAKPPVDSADYRWQGWPTADASDGFQRTHGGGQIIAFSEAPKNVHSHLAASAIRYPAGTILGDDQSDAVWFWRNLVQTVGRTPVWAFGGFVALFVLMVGPGLLSLTGRLRHRTLLLVLIPACSLILTTGMLLYNLLRGGNTTRGRVISIQYFDSHTSLGAAWSRQTYYCGFPPQNGLSFPNDFLVKPTRIGNDTSGAFDPRQQVIADICFQADSQEIKRWLRPRSQQQILIGQPLHAVSLPFEVSQVSEESIRFTNLSGNPLPLAILRAPKDKFYMAENISAHTSIDLEPLSLSSINAMSSKNADNWLPRVPEEINPLSGSLQRSRWSFGVRAEYSDAFEQILSMTKVLERLPTYGYLVITPESSSLGGAFPESVFEKEQNLHVLIGAHPWQAP